MRAKDGPYVAINQENNMRVNIHGCSDWQCEVRTPANALVQDAAILFHRRKRKILLASSRR